MSSQNNISQLSKWKQFRKSKIASIALGFLVILTFLAIFADLIANEKPIYCRYDGEAHYPIFTPHKIDSITLVSGQKISISYQRGQDWRKLPLTSAIWPLVPYSDTFQDRDNQSLVAPGDPQFLRIAGKKEPLRTRFKHWLGTTVNGQDVLAILIHSIRVSLLVGVLSILIATLIGVILGALAGYLGNDRLKSARSMLLMLPIAIFLAWFYGFYVRRFQLEDAGSANFMAFLGQFCLSLLISGVLIFVLMYIGKVLSRISPFLGKKVSVPVDSIVTRLIEILRAVPVIMLIISFSIVFTGSIGYIILIIGLTGWTGIARLVRAEMLRNVNLDYIEAARALGYSSRRTLFRHALPNGITPALVAISFGIASAILAESALSFLNIGVDPTTITWGKLLRMGSKYIDAWWLTVFPGFAIFLTVLSFNLIGERLRDVMDPKSD